ncbi:hypothetical protein [Catenovulum sediminis]|uniref:hypothetical protein n=1 Tax=Catenovulum sediminis TaxID=1740262 RepID=UPI001FEC3951|nr:hypothetical protein [Catenovulum sediminis]
MEQRQNISNKSLTDIEKFEKALKPVTCKNYQDAEIICEIIYLSQRSICNEQQLSQSLLLLESLSELSVEYNELLAVVLDKLIDNIEMYQSNQHKTANQILAELMKVHSTKQKDLAHILPQSIISELVNGKRKLTINHMQAFAEYFSVPVAYFIRQD